MQCDVPSFCLCELHFWGEQVLSVCFFRIQSLVWFSIHLVCQTGSEQGHISKQLLEAIRYVDLVIPEERRWVK